MPKEPTKKELAAWKAAAEPFLSWFRKVLALETDGHWCAVLGLPSYQPEDWREGTSLPRPQDLSAIVLLLKVYAGKCEWDRRIPRPAAVKLLAEWEKISKLPPPPQYNGAFLGSSWANLPTIYPTLAHVPLAYTWDRFEMAAKALSPEEQEKLLFEATKSAQETMLKGR